MKQVMVIRHVHFEDLGILEDVLVSRDYQISYIDAPTVDFSKLDPLSVDLLVVLGAPIGAFDEDIYPFLNAELAFIKQRLLSKKPLLGICLGAQLIARLLGANVVAMPHKEIGFSVLNITECEDNPLKALQDVPVLHWHGDQFDIPEGLISLAKTNLCPNQAFITDANVLALQFHMEANPLKIEQWLVGHASELHTSNIDIKQIREAASLHADSLSQAGKLTFIHWLEKLGL